MAHAACSVIDHLLDRAAGYRALSSSGQPPEHKATVAIPRLSEPHPDEIAAPHPAVTRRPDRPAGNGSRPAFPGCFQLRNRLPGAGVSARARLAGPVDWPGPAAARTFAK